MDRQRELEFLREFYTKTGKLAIVYGRRRIGKSRLIREFLKSIGEGNYIYFVGGKRPLRANLTRLSKTLSEVLGFQIPVFSNLVDLFKFLINLVKDPFLVVLDEFSYLVEYDEGVLSDVQEIVDVVLESKNIKLILLGSLVSLMERRVLGRSSPLYGRADLALKLGPLDLIHLEEWFPNMDWRDRFIIFSVTGNVPRYLEFFEGKNVYKEIERNFFDSSSFLFRDGYELLKEELREPASYISILEAIANGMNKLSEISNFTYIEPVKLASYLSTLRSLGIVERIIPIFAPKKSKRGRYYISDYYFSFWYRFVSPHFEEIESDLIKPAITRFRNDFNTYLGWVYEDFIRRNFSKILAPIGFEVTKSGKWWHKDTDVDVLGINKRDKLAVICEVKWKKINRGEAHRVIGNLERKAEEIKEIKNFDKKYCIVCKEKTISVEEENILLFDLNDVIKSLKTAKQAI